MQSLHVRGVGKVVFTNTSIMQNYCMPIWVVLLWKQA